MSKDTVEYSYRMCTGKCNKKTHHQRGDDGKFYCCHCGSEAA